MEGKIVLITGGTSGYGKAMAQLFVQAGAKVIIAARKVAELEETAKEIGCDTLCMDVTDFAAWQDAKAYIMDRYGRIDVLINNAGGGIAIKNVVEQTKEEIDQAIKLNLNSVIYGANVFAPVLVEQQSGTIINISSVCAKECWPEWSVYAAAKAGVLNFSKGLYTELQNHGVRVTCLIPAQAATRFQSAAGLSDSTCKLGVEDIAQTALFICQLPARAVVEEVTVWGIDQVVVPL